MSTDQDCKSTHAEHNTSGECARPSEKNTDTAKADCCHNVVASEKTPSKKGTSACASSKASEASSSSCCSEPKSGKGLDQDSNGTQTSCCDTPNKFDTLLWGSLGLVVIFYALHLFPVIQHHYLHHFSLAVYDLMNSMFIGLVIGVVMVALLNKVPREFVLSILGDKSGFVGIARATLAGVLLDLCSHGILMVGAKLYERGASAGQVMAFLIASPWNSFSLTIILIALIGLSWTLIFIVLSVVIAVITGLCFDYCVSRSILPNNPNRHSLPHDFRFWSAAKSGLGTIRFSKQGCGRFLLEGLQESRMVIRWLLFGIVLASLIRTFIPEEVFSNYLGPTLLGLGITLVSATLLEVCSEGSTPIAADIFNRASSPGNSFTFLMAGVSTDYTEIMVIKERMRSWKIALFLPLITLPQILLIALVLNFAL